MRRKFLLLFITTFAVQRKTNPRRAAFLCKYPFSRCQWRIVSHMLTMAAIQNRAPMVLVVLIEPDDYALHFRRRPDLNN